MANLSCQLVILERGSLSKIRFYHSFLEHVSEMFSQLLVDIRRAQAIVISNIPRHVGLGCYLT